MEIEKGSIGGLNGKGKWGMIVRNAINGNGVGW